MPTQGNSQTRAQQGASAKSRPASQAGCTAVDCRKQPLASLTVMVSYDPLKAPVGDALVTITGPSINRSLITDGTGIITFADLPPGQYQIGSKYQNKNTLVDISRGYIDKTDWAVASERSPYHRGNNKCNLFVYEMVTAAGFFVPMKPHEQKALGFTVRTVHYPPLAGDWANPNSEHISGNLYKVVSFPEPGDVVALQHNYADASGHVGIVSYPKDAEPVTKAIKPGEKATVEILMKRQSVSAGRDKILEDTEIFWHYYTENNTIELNNILFRRPEAPLKAIGAAISKLF